MNFNPGFVASPSVETCRNTNINELLENFYLDCEALQIEAYEMNINDKPKHGGYKIFMYLEARQIPDFHFIRENQAGILSHKDGYNGSIQAVEHVTTNIDAYELIRTLEIVKPVIRERRL